MACILGAYIYFLRLTWCSLFPTLSPMTTLRHSLTLCGLAAAILSAPLGRAAASKSGVVKLPFGNAHGKSVDLYVLTNSHGLTAKIATYGATLTELDVPDRHGKLDDIVLGFDSMDGYLSKEPFFGAIVGRVRQPGSRRGKFTLDGKSYQLALNDGKNHLHGGVKGFDKVVWTVKDSGVGPHGPYVELSYLSPDGEEGYPGNCTVHGCHLHPFGRERTLNRL